MCILRHELRRSATCRGAVDRLHSPLADQHTEHRPAMAFATATVLWNAGALSSTILPLAACSNDWALCAVEEPGEDPACFDQCALVGTIIGVKPMADHDQISLSVAPARLGSQVTRLEPLRVRAGLEAKTRKVGESMTAVVRLTRRTSNVNFYQGTWFGHQFSHNWRGAKLIRIDAISEQCRPPRVCALAKWRDAIGAMSLPPKLQGTLLALILGQSESIDANLWRALQQTGTIHLMVVSGLHVGFLMLVFFKVLRWIQLPATFCLVLAATVGMGYVAVIGVAIPSLRAWVMTSFLLLSQVSRSWQTNGVSFLTGLFVTLLLFPHSVAEPGFWFSFSAVAYLVSREQLLGGWVAWIRSAIEIQLSLILISWPILMLQGLPVSPLAGLFNLLAVPTVISFCSRFAGYWPW